MKICTIKIKMPDEINQNMLKAWLKTIPVEISAPGDQTITYELCADEG